MRIRCPRANHPFEIPDDYAGKSVLCPQCGCVVRIEANEQADAAGLIRAREPEQPNSEPDNLDEQIYDGMPPLSVMMALKRQRRAYDDDDLLSKLEMTPDDWKALGAFESALRAAATVRTAMAVGSVVLTINIVCWIHVTTNYGAISAGRRIIERAGGAGFVVLLVCFLMLLLGSLALERIRSNALVDFLIGAAGCAAVVYSSSTGFLLYDLFVEHASEHTTGSGVGVVLSVVCNLIAIAVLSLAAWRVANALKQIEPPEITNRLVEALKYLS